MVRFITIVMTNIFFCYEIVFYLGQNNCIFLEYISENFKYEKNFIYVMRVFWG